MLAAPIYFGAAHLSAFGFLHWPKGPVRGAAVLCPPLAYEEVCAHTALRQLAEQLAESGVVVLRVDYDGTGNSLPSRGEVGRVEAWTATIGDAVAQLGAWGLPSVTLVGLRFGATLAAAASKISTSVTRLVLWDPIVSGRRYARSMRMFSAAGGNQPTSGDGVSIAGVEFDGPTLAEMQRTAIAPEQLTVPTLIVARSEAESEAHALAADAAAQDVELIALEGTSKMLDTDAELARVPDQILREITAWIREHLGGPIDPQPDRPVLQSEVTEVHDGVVLRHRATRVGPSELFAVETVRDDADPQMAVITLNNGVARSIGPGGAWVEFAGMLATDGYRVLRVDLTGLGDSPARPGRVENDTYAPTAGDDLGELIEHLRADGISRIALLGLCSGAVVGFDAAFVHPEIEALVSINGRFDKPFDDRRADRPKRAAGQTNRLLAIPLSKTPLLGFFEKVPTWSWRVLDRVHLVATPTIAIEKAIARDVRVFLVFGTEEWGLGALRARGGKRFTSITSDPMTTLEEVSGLDHSMFESSGRAAVKALVHRFFQDLAADTRSAAHPD